MLFIAIVSIVTMAENSELIARDGETPGTGNGNESSNYGREDSIKQKNGTSDTILKMGGTLWTSYEFKDYDEAGNPDSTGPSQQSTGFRIGRALVEMDARKSSGPLEGVRLNISMNAFTTYAQEGNGCDPEFLKDDNPVCSQRNDYTVSLRNAFIEIPVYGKKGPLFRLGQQPVPTVSSPAYSLTRAMGYRFLDAWPASRMGATSAFMNFGFSSSLDRGVSIYDTYKYGSFHFMIGNESTYSRNNGQALNFETNDGLSRKLTNLSQGKGDSHGLDFQGLLHFQPTGKRKDFQIHLSLPFLFKNFTGMESREVEYKSVNIACSSDCLHAPRMIYMKGNKRAYQDIYYGLQLDGVVQRPNWKITMGGGPYFYVDRREDAFMVTERILNPHDFFFAGYDTREQRQILLGTDRRYESDTQGRAAYMYLHGEYESVGIFGMYTAGTGSGQVGNGVITGVVSAPSAVPWVMQAAHQDISRDGELGNTNIREIYEMSNFVDEGRSHFEKVLLAITWSLSPDLRLALGVVTSRGWQDNGNPVRVHYLDSIEGNPDATGLEASSLTDQVDGVLLPDLGVPDGVSLRDLNGRTRIEKQTFFAMEYKL